MDQSRWLQRWATALETALLATLLVAMLALACTQIVLRNFFDSGISWADPMIRALVLWTGLVGAIAAARSNKHIRIDLLARYFHGRWAEAVEALARALTALVAAVVAWYGTEMVISEYDYDTVAFANVPTWTVQSIIPLAFGCIALIYFVAALLSVARAVTGRSAAREKIDAAARR